MDVIGTEVYLWKTPAAHCGLGLFGGVELLPPLMQTANTWRPAEGPKSEEFLK